MERYTITDYNLESCHRNPVLYISRRYDIFSHPFITKNSKQNVFKIKDEECLSGIEADRK